MTAVLPSAKHGAVFHVAVMNANVLTGNDVIGTYNFDLAAVYNLEHHEVFGSWVPLLNDEGGEMSAPSDAVQGAGRFISALHLPAKAAVHDGLQGLLQLSVSVLGPGDAPHVHAEGLPPATSVLGADAMVLRPASLNRKQIFFVASIFGADGLSPLTNFRGTGLDAYVRLSIGGGVTAKTKVVKARGKSGLHLEFLEELWLPVLMPAMADSVRLELLENDLLPGLGAPQLLGSMTLSLRAITAAARKNEWIPLYGAPDELSSVGASRMNNFPQLASAFKGRLLAGFRVEAASGAIKSHAHEKGLTRLPSLPPSGPYRVRALVLLGEQLPALRSSAADVLHLANNDVGVMVAVGDRCACTPRAKHEGGAAQFNSIVEFDVELPLPAENGGGFSSPLPDTFVYLYRGEPPPAGASLSAFRGQRVCFARLNTAKLVARGFAGSLPQWLALHEDVALDALGDDEKPGKILLRLGVEDVSARPREAVDASLEEWREELKAASALVPYELRVHCFRGEGLPVADADGSIDPFLRMQIAGQTRRTQTSPKTRSPGWFETMSALVLLPTPPHLRLAPLLHIALFDTDRLEDEFVAELSLPVSSFEVVTARDAAAPAQLADLPRPAWHELTRLDSAEDNHAAMLLDSVVSSGGGSDDDCGGGFAEMATVKHRGKSHGRILISCQLLRREPAAEGHAQQHGFHLPSFSLLSGLLPHSSALTDHSFVPIPPPPPITPASLPFFLEVVVLGLRSMKPVAGLSLMSPSLTLDVGDKKAPSQTLRPVGGRALSHAASALAVSHMSKSDWNVCERVLLPIAAPLDALFAGALNLTVTDARLAVSLVAGTCTAPLASKIPWSPTFVPEKADVGAPPAAHPDIGQQPSANASASASASASAPAATATASSAPSTAPAGPDAPQATAAPNTALPATLMDEFGFDHARLLEAVDGGTVGSGGDSLATARYMRGRRVYSAALEDALGPAMRPFERFPLVRGHRVGRGASDAARECGAIKCVVRLVKSQDAAPAVDLSQFRAQQPVVVRVYVLRGVNLAPVSATGGAHAPYLLLRLGGEVVAGDRSRFVRSASSSPDFFQCFEFQALLPGPAELKVEAWGHSAAGAGLDEEIGKTVIDLEDRFFSRSWRGIGAESETQSRLRPKPVETRALWSARHAAARGALRLWVDILTPQQALRFRPVDVSPPPPVDFEVRVIVFGARDVDGSKGRSFSVRADLRGAAETHECESDVHYHAHDVDPAWNWRFVFHLALPAKFPYLTLQLMAQASTQDNPRPSLPIARQPLIPCANPAIPASDRRT